jgi:type IV secretory pathway VirB10-like protein
VSDELEPEREPAGDPEEKAAEDRASRRTTILIIAAAVVVLAAIGLGVYLVATAGDENTADDPDQPSITGSSQPEPPPVAPPPSDPPGPSSSPAADKPEPPAPANENVAAARTTAEQATTAINKRDVAAMRRLSCDPSTIGSVDAFPPEATARLAENPQITGDKATAQLELSIQGSAPTLVPMPMEKRGGKWCVP